MTRLGRRSRPALGLVAIAAAATSAWAQQSTLDPYKPDTRRYQAFASPSATVRPGFPDPLGNGQRQLYGPLDPNEVGLGGIDSFAPPYYNRYSPSLNRALANYGRSVADLSRQPATGPIDPQEQLDRQFYRDMQKKDDPYLKLQQRRDELYFKALQEPDVKKRAELLKEYNKASQKSAQALAAPRRDTGTTASGTGTGVSPLPTRGAASGTRGRPLTSGSGTRPGRSLSTPGTRASVGRSLAADDESSLGSALERSDRLDREQGLDPVRPATPEYRSRRDVTPSPR
jgi:hypothetical protein